MQECWLSANCKTCARKYWYESSYIKGVFFLLFDYLFGYWTFKKDLSKTLSNHIIAISSWLVSQKCIKWIYVLTCSCAIKSLSRKILKHYESILPGHNSWYNQNSSQFRRIAQKSLFQNEHIYNSITSSITILKKYSVIFWMPVTRQNNQKYLPSRAENGSEETELSSVLYRTRGKTNMAFKELAGIK